VKRRVQRTSLGSRRTIERHEAFAAIAGHFEALAITATTAITVAIFHFHKLLDVTVFSSLFDGDECCRLDRAFPKQGLKGLN
jgi:hypothetical protein